MVGWATPPMLDAYSVLSALLHTKGDAVNRSPVQERRQRRERVGGVLLGRGKAALAETLFRCPLNPMRAPVRLP